MTLDLTIHGDTAAIDQIADALQSMNDHLVKVTLKVMETSAQATRGWYGDAAEDYRTAVSRVHVSQLPVNNYLDSAAQVFRAYAQQLRWGRDYFEEILASAQSIGLVVTGTTIAYPTTWLTYCPDPNAPYTPSGPTVSMYQTGSRAYRDVHGLSPEMNEWNDYSRRVEAYNEASTKVGTWEGELNQWLAEHMAPLIGEIPELSEIADVYRNLREASHTAIDVAIEGAKARVQLDMSALRAQQEGFSKAATESLEAARSGNSGRLTAYQAFDVDGTGARVGGLEAKINRAAHYSRILGSTGVVTDLAFAAYEISQGGSESAILAGVGGGLAASAIAGAAFTGPVGAGVAVVVLAGAAGSQASTWLWENTMDLDTREAVDHWLDENVFWDSTSGTLIAGR